MRTLRQLGYRRAVIGLALLALVTVACSFSALAGELTTASPTSTVEAAGATAAAEVEEAPARDETISLIPTALPSEILAEADAEELLLINIYQRVNPAVVNIEISVDDQNAGLLDLGNGSGFVVDPEGYIVTNNHVIQQADAVRVTFADGSVQAAEVVGTDAYSDLAVLKVELAEGQQLVAVELGDSDNLLVGQRVIAIGNPFALSGTMTVGIISAVGRQLTTAAPGGGFSNPMIIQTDAAINPGNSGGPLLDSRGRVIGVNTAIRSTTGSNMGIGFAVPVNTVKRIVPQIIETGAVAYPYLGITSDTRFSLGELALEFELPVTEGVLISETVPGGSAERAGLRGGTDAGLATFRGQRLVLDGDIITAIDGFPVHNFDELMGYLVSNTDVGQVVELTVLRNSEELTIDVTLDPRPNGAGD